MAKLEKQDIYDRIIMAAWSDENFKNELISRPTEAVIDLFGDDFGLKNKKVVVDDQSDKKIVYLNIPHKPNMEDIELTEQQLDIVSGGISIDGVLKFLSDLSLTKVF